jgi:hypothetical protein
MKKIWVNVLLTALYYACVLCFMVYVGSIGGSGPCSPNILVLIFPIVPIVSLVLLTTNAYQYFRDKPENKGSLLIHLFALIASIGLIVFI